MEKLAIHTEYIKLDQFLKLTQLVSSGGEASSIFRNTPLLSMASLKTDVAGSSGRETSSGFRKGPGKSCRPGDGV